jgi:hypothetical protein
MLQCSPRSDRPARDDRDGRDTGGELRRRAAAREHGDSAFAHPARCGRRAVGRETVMKHPGLVLEPREPPEMPGERRDGQQGSGLLLEAAS